MSRYIQELLLEEQEARRFDYGKEFRLKVSVDYRVYLFLSPKRENVFVRELVAYSKRYSPDFEAYREVYKGDRLVHLYLKFRTAEVAKIAMQDFQTHYKDQLHIASVADMLEAMYSIESCERRFPLWTSTVVDVVGEVLHSDPLARDHLSSFMRKFGDPRIFDLQREGRRVKNAQALFSSLAEALGACIVNGAWVDDTNPSQSFYYRVRIVNGEKELHIFRQLRIPNVDDVFKMEYFLVGESPSFDPAPPSPPVFEQPFPPEFAYQQPPPPPPMRPHQPQPEFFQNGYPSYQTNQPQQRDTRRPQQQQQQRGGRRSFPRRQFNNRKPRQQAEEPPTRQEASVQVPGN